MQDRYAGDIGDYIKVGLLRALSRGRTLGVAWYRFPDEAHNADGRHTSYLAQPEIYRSVDPELFDHLGSVVKEKRSINSLLPMLPGVRSFEESVDFSHHPSHERRACRKMWFERANGYLSGCDLVFADPDNGIVDNDEKRKSGIKFGKQIALNEAVTLANGRCAVIYHHNTRRKGGHDLEVDHWLKEIGLSAIAVRATAFSARTFFIINPDEKIRNEVAEFCSTWGHLKVREH